MSGQSRDTVITTSDQMIGNMRVQQSSYGIAIPIVYGRTRVSSNLIWYGDFQAIPHTTTTTTGGGGGGGKGGGGGGGGTTQVHTYYTYEASFILALAEGPVFSVDSIWRGKERFKNLSDIGLSFGSGNPQPGLWGYLNTKFPDQTLGYSNTALVFGSNYQLTKDAQIHSMSYEVSALLSQFDDDLPDANPADIIYDLLTNTRYGAGLDPSLIADLSDYRNYCLASGLMLSPIFAEQKPAYEHIRALIELTNSALFWSEGKLKIIPFADAPVSGHGVTYTPNTTPVFDLSDNDYYVTGTEAPVQCRRRTPADAYNRIQIEFLNRSNSYNIEIAEAKDQANIETNGLRSRELVSARCITSESRAQYIAQLLLQRALYVRNEYDFKLPWTKAILEPMDLITLTDSVLGLNKTPVRIISISEDAAGVLSIIAEEYPFGVASASRYPSQVVAGYQVDYNAEPGPVTPPAFFEPPIELCQTGLEVWAAVSGNNSFWGGANVWASLDGNTYKKVGRVSNGARYGTLTANLGNAPGGNLAINLVGNGGQMLSGTAADATALSTLCWVQGAVGSGGEFLAYTSATLTATNAYTLSGLVRGAYGSDSSAKPTGRMFARIDGAIAKSEPLALDMIGKTLQFKFTSFNIWGGAEQSLVDAIAYPYTISGAMVKLPPSDVTGLSIDVASNGVRVSWAACPDQDYAATVLRIGDTWATATEVARKNANSHLLSWQKSGDFKVWAAHLDQFGNLSKTPTSAVVTIAQPAPVDNLRLATDNTGLNATWTMPDLSAYAQPIAHVELSTSASFSPIFSSTKGTTVPMPWGTPGLKQVFARTVDVAGNIGSTASTILTLHSPSAPVGLVFGVSNTGVNLSWTAPSVASDQQPLAGVQLSRLADFSAIIETRSATSVDLGWLAAGSHTFYARYTDVAGNSGSAASLTFSIQAPCAPLGLALSFGTSNIEATWTEPGINKQQQAFDHIELSWGPQFTTVIDGRKTTTTTFGWLSHGPHTLYARYVDKAGNIGGSAQTTLQVLPPNQPVMTSVESQINAVTLRWHDAKTSQPIRKYAIYYGDGNATLDASQFYGSAGADSRSDILFYRSSGYKVAYLVAEDVAGNRSPERKIDLHITMPTDFVMASEYYEDWQTVELTNGTMLGGANGQIVLPSYAGRSWGQRLTNHNWDNAQQKMAAGFPMVIQPVPLSGKHTERHDLGKVLPAGLVRVRSTQQVGTEASAIGTHSTIRVRGSQGDTDTLWGAWLIGDAVSLAGFRYVEVEYSVSSDGKGFVVLDDIYVKVEVTEVTEAAMLVLNAADATGTPYVCTKGFLDVRTAQATALNSPQIARINCVVDDSAPPVKIFVQAWDNHNNRVGGTVSLYLTGV